MVVGSRPRRGTSFYLFFASNSETTSPIFEILFDSESEKCAGSDTRNENHAATTEIPEKLAIFRFSTEFCEYNIWNNLLTIKYRLPFPPTCPFSQKKCLNWWKKGKIALKIININRTHFPGNIVISRELLTSWKELILVEISWERAWRPMHFDVIHPIL